MALTYFGATVKYDKLQEDGTQKTITEQYIINAMSVQEASDIVTENVAPYAQGEFNVDNVRKVKLEELIEAESNADDRWYMVKIAFTYLDEKTGKEKVNITRSLICCDTLENAIARFTKLMQSVLGEWRYVSVTETKYLDYFKPASE